MFKVFLDSVEAGVIHADAHLYNWFAETQPVQTYPRLVLGDWGINIFRPRKHEGQQGLERWYEAAQEQIYTRIVEEIRLFILHGASISYRTVAANDKEKLRKLVDQVLWKGEPGFESLAMLVHFVNQVDYNRPSALMTGEAWLAQLNKIYSQMMHCHHNPVRSDPGAAHHSQLLPSDLPDLAFEEAMEVMFSWNRLDGTASLPTCLWLTAELDQDSEIVSSSRPPATFRRGEHEDMTDWDFLPAEWIQAHERTIAQVQQWVPDFGLAGNYAKSDYQGDLYGGSVF